VFLSVVQRRKRKQERRKSRYFGLSLSTCHRLEGAARGKRAKGEGQRARSRNGGETEAEQGQRRKERQRRDKEKRKKEKGEGGGELDENDVELFLLSGRGYSTPLNE
jgi:hypothetical protein